jgi:hypothetical protein
MFFLCVTRCPIYHQHTPYGLGVGVKRICDDKEEYEKERSKIKERLTQRGYNSNLIEKQLLKVDELDRKETLKIVLFLKTHYPKQLWCPKIQFGF